MLFDSTLRKDLSRSFGATLVVIMTIVLTMMLIRTIGQAASGAVAGPDATPGLRLQTQALACWSTDLQAMREAGLL